MILAEIGIQSCEHLGCIKSRRIGWGRLENIVAGEEAQDPTPRDPSVQRWSRGTGRKGLGPPDLRRGLTSARSAMEPEKSQLPEDTVTSSEDREVRKPHLWVKAGTACVGLFSRVLLGKGAEK